MANPNQQFIVIQMTRAEIAGYLNSILVHCEYDARFAENDDRLTDAICAQFAQHQRNLTTYLEENDDEGYFVETGMEFIAQYLS